MQIICISDTHNFHNEVIVPNGDVLIHAGDATSMGSTEEVAAFADWFGNQPHKWKIFVAGNHDWLFQKDKDLAESVIGTYGIIYLRDWGCSIEGINFYGSPWQPEFCNWAFNLPRDGNEIQQKWQAIPQNTDVLITHGPPFGILDEESGRCIGDRCLRERVLHIKPALHIFGHIHASHGEMEWNGTHFINAAICDQAYKTTNPPIVVSIETPADRSELLAVGDVKCLIDPHHPMKSLPEYPSIRGRPIS